MSYAQKMQPPIEITDLQSGELSGEMGEPMSLEDRMVNSYADASISAGQERNALMRAASDPSVTSDPEQLYKLQTQMSEFVIKMNLTSTLARKAVGCVETLIKAQ